MDQWKYDCSAQVSEEKIKAIYNGKKYDNYGTGELLDNKPVFRELRYSPSGISENYECS